MLTYLGHEYIFYRNTNGLLTWRCRKNRTIKCHSNMKTKDGNIEQEPTEHCHGSCPQNARANICLSLMRENMKAIGATPRNVIGNALSQLSNEVMAHMPKNHPL